MRKMLIVLGAALIFARLTALEGAVTVTETKAGDRTAVTMENDFIKLTFEPEKGGECTAFLYKPTSKQLLLANEGSLVGSRVWNYADKELYQQWQNNPWEYEIKRSPTEITLVMRAAGQVGFTRSTLFEKRVTLRDGEAMARIEHVFHVGQELMVPQKIGLWFYNRCGVVGEQNLYCFPLDDGIVTVDPAAGVNQEWFYNPSRGWAAVAAGSGDGLCFNMEYRRLMCFYMCQGKQPTFEWAFRTADIPNGDSLRTEEMIIPFSGLKRVHGSGGGIVAGFEAPAKCALADAQKGVPVKVILTAGNAQNGELTVDVRRLSDGQPRNLFKQEVTLAPAKVSASALQFKAEQEGTWLLTGHVSVGGKEVMDFMTPIVVGAESAPVRIAEIGRAHV